MHDRNKGRAECTWQRGECLHMHDNIMEKDARNETRQRTSLEETGTSWVANDNEKRGESAWLGELSEKAIA